MILSTMFYVGNYAGLNEALVFQAVWLHWVGTQQQCDTNFGRWEAQAQILFHSERVREDHFHLRCRVSSVTRLNGELQRDRILQRARAPADVALDPALVQPVHETVVRTWKRPTVNHRQRLHHRSKAQPVLRGWAFEAAVEENFHLLFAVEVIVRSLQNFVPVRLKQVDGQQPQRVGRCFWLRRRFFWRIRTHSWRFSKRDGGNGSRRWFVMVTSASVWIIRRIFGLSSRPEHDDVPVALVRALVEVLRRAASIEMSGNAFEAIRETADVTGWLASLAGRAVRTVANELNGVVVGSRTPDAAASDGPFPVVLVAATSVRLVDVRVVVAETDVPGEPGPLTGSSGNNTAKIFGPYLIERSQCDRILEEKDGHIFPIIDQKVVTAGFNYKVMSVKKSKNI